MCRLRRKYAVRAFRAKDCVRPLRERSGYSRRHKRDGEGFSELEEHRWAEAGLKTVRCDNCGATETVKGDEIATVCPFCSSPLVLEEHCFDGVKPDSLIPFSLDRQKGLEACKKWLKKRFFAPSKFKKT